MGWVKQLNVMGQPVSGGFTSPPVLRTLASGNEVILAGQISGVVYGLDPDHGGEIRWQNPLGADGDGGGGAWGTAAQHRSFFVSPFCSFGPPGNPRRTLLAPDPQTRTARGH